TIADLGYGPACLARSGAPAPGQHAARCEPLWAANHTRASRHAWTTTVTRRPSSTGCRTARICRTGTHAGTTSLPTAWWRSFRIHRRQTRPLLPPPADHGRKAPERPEKVRRVLTGCLWSPWRTSGRGLMATAIISFSERFPAYPRWRSAV